MASAPCGTVFEVRARPTACRTCKVFVRGRELGGTTGHCHGPEDLAAFFPDSDVARATEPRLGGSAVDPSLEFREKRVGEFLTLNALHVQRAPAGVGRLAIE